MVKLGQFLGWSMGSLDNEVTINLENPPEAPKKDTFLWDSPDHFLLGTPQRLYQVAVDNLGKHLTLNASVLPEVGCAEAVSWLLLNAGYPIPQGGIPTVTGLVKWMLAQGFVEENKYQTGFIITGRNKTSAHIGICGKDWIMSNTSYTDTTKGLIAGTLQANYRKASWSQVYPQTRYFRPV